MKTFAEVAEWCEGAEASFGDPALPVAQVFLRYVTDVDAYWGEDLVCGMPAQKRTVSILRLRLWPTQSADTSETAVDVPISRDGPELRENELVGFAIQRIAPGLWCLSPSLNMPGLIHAFVTLYDVPNPAP